jgi:hypothetical protein
LQKVQVEVSTQNALAQQFGVPTSSVTTTATASRRLEIDANMNIAGTWTVDYQLYVRWILMDCSHELD